MKLCTKCKTAKEFSSFFKFKYSKDGYKSICKDCIKEQKRSKKSVLNYLYYNQYHTSIKRGMNVPLYTKDEFVNFMILNKDFNEIYDYWVANNYSQELKPSIDRLDDYETYSFDNIQVTTIKYNIDKSYLFSRLNINTKRHKKVFKYDIDGDFICSYNSLNEAERITGISRLGISNNCHNKLNSYKGFIWRFKED